MAYSIGGGWHYNPAAWVWSAGRVQQPQPVAAIACHQGQATAPGNDLAGVAGATGDGHRQKQGQSEARQHQVVPAEHLCPQLEGGDDAGDGQHRHQVEKIGAEHIADGDIVVAAQGARDGGRQFRQAGAHGNHGETNHQFTDAKLAGAGGGTPHQHLGTGEQSGEADGQPHQGDAGADSGNLFLQAELFRGWMVGLVADSYPQQRRYRQQQRQALPEAEAAVVEQQPDQGGDHQQHGALLAEEMLLGWQGGDQRGHPQYQADIGQVGAQGVAHRQGAGTLEGGVDGDDDLRRRGADGHYGQADD